MGKCDGCDITQTLEEDEKGGEETVIIMITTPTASERGEDKDARGNSSQTPEPSHLVTR